MVHPVGPVGPVSPVDNVEVMSWRDYQLMTQPPPPFLADTQVYPGSNNSVDFLRCVISVFDSIFYLIVKRLVQLFSHTDSFSYSATRWFVSPTRTDLLSYLLLIFNPLPNSDLQFQHSDGTDAMRRCKQQQQ